MKFGRDLQKFDLVQISMNFFPKVGLIKAQCLYIKGAIKWTMGFRSGLTGARHL